MKFEYYRENTIKSLKKQNIVFAIADILLFSIFITLFVLALVFVNDENILIFKILSSILLSLVLCFLFYSIMNIFIKNDRIKKHISSIVKTNDFKVIEGTIIKVENNVSIDQDIICYEVTIFENDKNINLLLKKECVSEVPENMPLIITCHNRYIVGMEKNEKDI